jgi:hypothetical protein
MVCAAYCDISSTSLLCLKRETRGKHSVWVHRVPSAANLCGRSPVCVTSALTHTGREAVYCLVIDCVFNVARGI